MENSPHFTSKMAADWKKTKLKDLNVSLAFSTSAGSVEAGKSDHEYTEDFLSSLQSSVEEISSKLTEISTDYSVIDDDRMSVMSQIFVGRKLRVLKENQVERIEKSTDHLRRRESHRDLGPFWLKKVEILRQRKNSDCTSDIKNKEIINIDKLNSMSINDKCGNKFVNIRPVTSGNEIGCFQTAYERLKFENLREKCRGLLNTEIHSLETCEKCQELQDGLLKDRFYTSCVGKVRRNIAEEKLSEHMQSRSSALLIANIIKDGPKPSWSSDEIWDKLLSGGYQHVIKSIQQN